MVESEIEPKRSKSIVAESKKMKNNVPMRQRAGTSRSTMNELSDEYDQIPEMNMTASSLKNQENQEISPLRFPRKDSPHPYNLRYAWSHGNGNDLIRNLRMKRPKPERTNSPEGPKPSFSKKSENELRLSWQMSDVCSSDLSDGDEDPFEWRVHISYLSNIYLLPCVIKAYSKI